MVDGRAVSPLLWRGVHQERLTCICQCKEVIGVLTNTTGLVVEVLDPVLHAQAIDHQLHQLVADLVTLIVVQGFNGNEWQGCQGRSVRSIQLTPCTKVL